MRTPTWCAFVLTLFFACVATAHATPKQVVINSPVDGTVSSSPFESPPHHIAYGQWAFDIHTSQQARPVYARFGPTNGNLTLEVIERSASSCKSGGGGWRVTVRARVDGIIVGDVYYLHLANPHGGGPISNGAQIGTAAVGLTPNSSCWTGPHVHVEGINRSGSASCARRIGLGAGLNGGSAIGVIGGGWAGANNQACPDAAFNVTGGGTAIANGSFIRIAGRAEVYRIAGGAPIYVDSWNHYGGSQPMTDISQSQFNQLRQYPSDGTAIDDGTHAYIMAGGAPVYVASWNNVGGPRSTVRVVPGAIANAGAGGVWDHLRQKPADGAFIAAGGHVYVIAGGAPIYVNAWDAVGGDRPVTVIDATAINLARPSAPWNHLSQYPADGTTITGFGNATVYVIAGGAPIAVTDWNRIGGGRPTTAVSQAALDRAGDRDMWSHLRRYPSDGTFLTGNDGHVFRFAGGAPIYVQNWSRVGGAQPTVAVDIAAIDKAGGTGAWRSVADRPADSTVLRAGPTGAYYRTASGVPQRLPGSAPGAVVVDPVAITNAGQPGYWRFLRAALTPGGGDVGNAPISGGAGAPSQTPTPVTEVKPPTAAPSAPIGPFRLSAARLRSAVVIHRGPRVRIGIAATPGRAYAGRRVLVQRKVGSRYRALMATKVQRNGKVRAIITLNRKRAGLRGARGVRKVVIRLALPKTRTAPGRIGPARSIAVATRKR